METSGAFVNCKDDEKRLCFNAFMMQLFRITESCASVVHLESSGGQGKRGGGTVSDAGPTVFWPPYVVGTSSSDHLSMLDAYLFSC